MPDLLEALDPAADRLRAAQLARWESGDRVLLETLLPGEPTVTPQNMPGAGSVTATNHIYNVAAKDGLSLAIGSPSLPLIDALENPGARFKTDKLNWIARVDKVRGVIELTVYALWEGSTDFRPEAQCALDLANEELQRLRDEIDASQIAGHDQKSQVQP